MVNEVMQIKTHEAANQRKQIQKHDKKKKKKTRNYTLLSELATQTGEEPTHRTTHKAHPPTRQCSDSLARISHEEEGHTKPSGTRLHLQPTPVLAPSPQLAFREWKKSDS